jgi:hypothetical protein
MATFQDKVFTELVTPSLNIFLKIQQIILATFQKCYFNQENVLILERGKIVILTKRVQTEAKKTGDCLLMTLTTEMHRITFGIIAR